MFLQNQDIDIVDQRSWHPPTNNGKVVVNEIYCRDQIDITDRSDTQKIVDARMQTIRESIMEIMHAPAATTTSLCKVRVQRWYPHDMDETCDETPAHDETTVQDLTSVQEDSTTTTTIQEVPAAPVPRRRRQKVCSVPSGGSLFGQDCTHPADGEHRGKLVLNDNDEPFHVRISEPALQSLRSGDTALNPVSVKPDLSSIHHLQGLVRGAHST